MISETPATKMCGDVLLEPLVTLWLTFGLELRRNSDISVAILTYSFTYSKKHLYVT